MNLPLPLQIRNAMLDMLRSITTDNGYLTDVGKMLTTDGYAPPTGVPRISLGDYEEDTEGLNGVNKYRCNANFTVSADVPGLEESDYITGFNIQRDIKKALKNYLPLQGLMIGIPEYRSSQVGKGQDDEGSYILIVDVHFSVPYDDPVD